MFHWLRKTLGTSSQPRKQARRTSLRLECLEDRYTPAYLEVTTLYDGGPTSLRGRIEQANDGDTIGITVTGTMQLQSDIVLNKDLEIQGPGPGELYVCGSGVGGYYGGPEPEDPPTFFRVFTVEGGTDCNISGMTITNGYANTEGGGIHNNGTLALLDVEITDCTAGAFGGGIYNEECGTLVVSCGAIYACTAGISGGAIANCGDLVVDSFEIGCNTATAGSGGGIWHFEGTAELWNVEVSGHSAAVGGGGIYAFDTLTMEGGTLTGNWSDGLGAGILVTNGASVGLYEVEVTDNTATGEGGGFYVEDGWLFLHTCLLLGNESIGDSSTHGGAYDFNDGSVTTYLGDIFDPYTFV